MRRNVWSLAGAMAAGALAAALVAGQATAQRPAVPRKQKSERNQVMNEIARMHQAQLALFRRYAMDDDYAARLDDLMLKRDFRGAAAAAAEAAGLPLQSIEVSDVNPGGDDAQGGGVDGATAADGAALGAVIPAWVGSPSLRAVRDPALRLRGSEALATAGHVCFNFIVVKGCIDW